MKTKAMLMLSIFLAFLSILTITVSSADSGGRPAASLPGPRDEAAVTIHFDGMIAVCFGDPTRVSAGFLDVHHHTPEIIVNKISAGERVEVARLRGADLKGVLGFDIEGEPAGVRRYYGLSMDDPQDFRWTVDLENDLHQRQLYINEEKLFGKIHFTSGLFYAGKQSERPFRFFAADKPGQAHEFNRRVSAPMAKINLWEGQALVIKGREKAVRLAYTAGTRYEIEITNLPPDDMAAMDHWLYYYDIMGVKVTRYQPVMLGKAAYAPPPLMCEAAVFGKSKLR